MAEFCFTLLLIWFILTFYIILVLFYFDALVYTLFCYITFYFTSIIIIIMHASVPPSPMRPAVAPSVQLGVTVLYTSLYGGLFLVVYIQLWLLLLYRHKRWSYQSIFLFLCLFWAALRTTLFSFYFRDALAANHLPTPVYWLLYCFPVCLQFFTLSLFNLYFTQVSQVKHKERCLLSWEINALPNNNVSFWQELFRVRSVFNIEPSKGLWVHSHTCILISDYNF